MKAIQILFLTCLLLPLPSLGLAGAIDPRLQSELERVDPSEHVRILVYFQDQAALPSLAGDAQAVLAELRSTADRSRSAIGQFIDRRTALGLVRGYRHFWVVNVAALEATAGVVEEIASLPGIRTVYLDEEITPPVLPDLSLPQPERQGPCTWGIETIRADDVWTDFGLDGGGVVIGSIDTGVDATHLTILGKMALTGNSTPGWHDSNAGLPTPVDTHGHGTHTIGTMVGGSTNSSSLAIGVAPGAQYYSCRIFGPNTTTTAMTLDAGEWMMDPDGNPATDDFPNVINNSWTSPLSTDEWYRDMVENWRALGIFPVFAIGNNGPGGRTTGAPGNYPESFGVGATDDADAIANFSSRGPVAYDGQTHIKPDVAAPGVQVISARAFGTDMYGDGQHFVGPAQDLYWANGTSMAAPHIAGIVALILQANPNLTVDAVQTRLEAAALDVGAPGKDNQFGWGRIDAVDAVRQPFAFSTNALGEPRSPFLPYPGEDLWCRGGELLPSQSVAIRVVAHRGGWTIGDPIGDDLSGGVEYVTTTAAGTLDNTEIWAGPMTSGEYDVVVDVDRNGILGAADAIDNWVGIGVKVYDEVLLGQYDYPKSPNTSHFVAVVPNVTIHLNSVSSGCRNFRILEGGVEKLLRMSWTDIYYVPVGNEVELRSWYPTEPFTVDAYQTLLTQVNFTEGFNSLVAGSYGVELFYASGDGVVDIQNSGPPSGDVPSPRGDQWTLSYASGEVTSANLYFPVPEGTNDVGQLRLWRQDPDDLRWDIVDPLPAVTDLESLDKRTEYIAPLGAPLDSRATAVVFTTEEFGTFQIAEEPRGFAADVLGEETDHFQTGEQVYAKGEGFPALTPLDLYVVADSPTWTHGDPLLDLTGAPESSVTGVDGSLTQILVWSSASSGEYDLVADLNQSGTYDSGEPVDHLALTGFVVASVGEIQPCTAEGTPLYEFPDWLRVHVVGSGFTANRDSNLPLYFLLGPTVEDGPFAERIPFSEVEVGIDHEGRIRDPLGNLGNVALVYGNELALGFYSIAIDVDRDGNFSTGIDYSTTLEVVEVSEVDGAPAIPDRLLLLPMQPDPMRGSATIRFALPDRSSVELSVCDVSGRRVRSLRSGELENAGYHQVFWDGRNDRGHDLPAGVYFIRIRAGEVGIARRAVLMR